MSGNALKSTIGKITQTPKELCLLVLLAFFLPFDRFPTYGVLGIDIKLSSLIGLGLILLATFEFFKNQNKPFQRIKPFLPVIAWLLWMICSGLWVQNYNTYLRTFLPVAFLVVLAISITILWQKRYVRPVVASLLLGASASIVFGVFQFVGNFLGLPDSVTLIRPEYSWQGFGFPRVHSFSLEPLYFAGFLLLPIAILSARFITKGKLLEWRSLLLLLASISTVVLTLSRGAIAGLVLELLLIGFILRKEVKRLLSWRLIGGALAGFLISVSLVGGIISLFNKPGNDSDLTYGSRGVTTFVSHLTNTRFFANKDNKEKDDSIAQRDTARSQGLELVKSNKTILLRGAGSGQYEVYAKQKYQAAYKGEPNNMVIEQLIQGGVIGLSLLALFFIGLLHALYKNRSQWLATALFGYIIAILLQAQTFHGLTITHFWFAVGLAGAVLTYSRSDSETAIAKRPHTSQ